MKHCDGVMLSINLKKKLVVKYKLLQKLYVQHNAPIYHSNSVLPYHRKYTLLLQPPEQQEAHTHTHTFSSFLFTRLLFSAILFDQIVFFLFSCACSI